MLALFKEIRNEIKAAFAPPDPKRFAHLSVRPWNWNGEYEAKEEKKSGAILVDEIRNAWEFGRYASVEIPDYLTDLDKQGLKKFNLAPDNPAYSNCKKYFSNNPFCTKKELAANSGDEYSEGIMPETAAKVLAAFRAFLVDKPTF